MIYEQAKQLLDVLTKQNEALQRIAISLEELNQVYPNLPECHNLELLLLCKPYIRISST